MSDAGLKRRMVDEEQRRSRRRRTERRVEPLQRRRVKLAVMRPGHHGIQKHNVDAADLAHGIERAAWLGVAEAGQGRAHHVPAVVVAGDGSEFDVERRQEFFQMIVFGRQRRIDEIAGDHDEIGARLQPVQLLDAAHQRRRGIDLPIGAPTRLLDMKVGNLRNQKRTCGHYISPGRSRMAAGSMASPTRSPALMAMEFGTSTMMNLAAAPPIDARCRSPTKLTLSTWPDRAAPSGATMQIDSGRIMANTLLLAL